MAVAFEDVILPHTNKEVSDQLKGVLYSLNPSRNRYLVIHSSVLTFRQFERPVENSIRAFFEYANETGTTIFFPAFSLACCKTGRYSPRDTPCDTGLLSETIRKIDGVERSLHPIDSYVSYGENKAVVQTFFGESLHGNGSAAEFFDKNNALVVAWGVKLSYLTIIHYYEFMSDVPYRFCKTFEGVIVNNGKQSKYSFKFKVRNHDLLKEDASFDHLHELLLKNIPFQKLSLNGAPFFSAKTKQVGDFLLPHLQKYPLAFLNNPDYFQKAISGIQK